MDGHIKGQLERINQQVKEICSIYHGAASCSGISDNEFWVWYALLVLGGEYSQQDICEMWSLSKQTVNSVVSNLVKKGFVSLEAVPGTRNRKIIRLSAEGRAWGERIVTPVCRAEAWALGKLSEQERQMCITLLGSYTEHLREALQTE